MSRIVPPRMDERDTIDGEDVAAILGVSGSGKSTRVREVLSRHCKGGGSVLRWDPHDEGSIQGRASSKVTLGDLPRRLTVEEFLDRCPELCWEEQLQAAIVPTKDAPAEVAEQFCLVMDAFVPAAKLRSSELLFWASELQMLEGSAEALDYVDYLATQGRHLGEGVAVGFDAQAAVMFPPRARRQFKWFRAFNLTNALDLRALEDMGGVTLPEGWREIVPNLGPHESLFWESPLRAKKREQREQHKHKEQ